MDLLMSSLCITEKKSLVEINVDDEEIPPPPELVRTDTIRVERFILDKEVEEDDAYKWYEMVCGEKVRRNNEDESLTPEGLPTIETQLSQIEQRDIEQIKEL